MAAVEAIEAAGTPTDAAMATQIATPSSATRQALNATIAQAIEENVPPIPAGVITSAQVSNILWFPEGTPVDYAALPAGTQVEFYVLPGASYFDDFSDGTLDAAPAGWTNMWDAMTWAVVAEAGGTGGKALRVSPTQAGRYALGMDALSSDPDRANVEVLLRFKTAADANSGITAAARISGDGNSETGYRGGQNASQVVALSKYAGGTFATLATPSYTFAAATWYMTRFRANGSTLSVKVWRDGDPEPSGWLASYTDTSGAISAPGLAGVAATANGAKYIDWVAIATGGRTAVKPT